MPLLVDHQKWYSQKYLLYFSKEFDYNKDSHFVLKLL